MIIQPSDQELGKEPDKVAVKHVWQQEDTPGVHTLKLCRVMTYVPSASLLGRSLWSEAGITLVLVEI